MKKKLLVNFTVLGNIYISTDQNVNLITL